jgi:CHAD domain-containing protein
MNRKQIVEVTDTRFKNLNKILPKVVERFDNESIHHFRLETKKLRAFLRLCSIELNEANELRIPKTLKRFYGYIGIIENLQLQQQKLALLLNNEDKNCDAYKSYRKFLHTEEHYWKVQAKALPNTENLDDEKELVIDLLPYKISNETLKKFVSKKAEELNELLTSTKDESLHRIRKIINDLLYNWPYINAYAPLLLSRLMKQEKLIAFSELLAEFRNVSIALNLLNSTLRDNEKTNPESVCLEKTEAQWQHEKEKIKEQACVELLGLTFIPSSCY